MYLLWGFCVTVDLPVGGRIWYSCHPLETKWSVTFVSKPLLRDTYSIAFISTLTPWISLLSSTLFWFIKSFNNLCFSCNLVYVFPKAPRLQLIKAYLQCLIFSNSWNIRLPLTTMLVQASSMVMVSSQLGCVTHIFSNLYGTFFLCVCWFELWVQRTTGTWSE